MHNFALVSHFTFVFLTHLYRDKDIEWYNNEAHHCKGLMDRSAGTIENNMFQEVKSGRIASTARFLSGFATHPSRLIQSSTTLYFPKKDIFEEPASSENALYIKGRLDIHKVKRKWNDQSVIFLEFWHLSFDEKPFYNHFYRKSSSLVVCGHESFRGSNCWLHCLNDYHVGEEWMECPVCKQ